MPNAYDIPWYFRPFCSEKFRFQETPQQCCNIINDLNYKMEQAIQECCCDYSRKPWENPQDTNSVHFVSDYDLERLARDRDDDVSDLEIVDYQ